MNEKLKAAEKIKSAVTELADADVLSMLEIPADRKMGDIALPCFKLSRMLKKAPPVIADSICEKLNADAQCLEIFDKIESVNGYLNFFI